MLLRLADILHGSFRTAHERLHAQRLLTAASSALRAFEQPYQLHIGCGANRFDGWINIDLYKTPGVVDLQWNIAKPLPLPDNSCRFIYHEHVLEHLPVDLGQRFLVDCRRLLEPDGVLRVAMPSLEHLVERYCSAEWRQQAWLEWPEHRSIRTRAEMLNVALRSWGHQWVYDWEELERRLRDAGFGTIVAVKWGESGHATLRGLETRPDSLLLCEASPRAKE